MLLPTKIILKADGNVLEYVETKGKIHYYQYTKSVTKKGLITPYSEDDLAKLLKINEQ